MEMKELCQLGVNYRTAPAGVREALSFNRSEAMELLREAQREIPDLEAVVLSTCNRTEFYLLASRSSETLPAWMNLLRRLRPEAPILRPECERYELRGAEAARHLFLVACCLDSSVLGDVQIFWQVRDAMERSRECGTLGKVLRQTFERAIQVGKRVRSETNISKGAASIGSALAGSLMEYCRSTIKGQKPMILIIGAGTMGWDIGRQVGKRRFGDILFVNRTDEKAVQCARHCGGQGRAYSELAELLVQADVVIAATSASEPILRREELNRVLIERGGKPLMVIDAGVPRNVEGGSEVEVIDIDGIRESQENILAERRAAVPVAEEMVAEEIFLWKSWCASLPLEGVIKKLYLDATVMSHQTAKNLSRFGVLDRETTEEIVVRSFRRLLHDHVHRLRGMAKSS